MRLRRLGRLARLALAALLTVAAQYGAALAHSKSVSYSEWSLRGDNELLARIALTARQATLLMGEKDAPTDPAEAAARAFERDLTARSGGRPCPRVGSARHLPTRPGSVVFELTFRCSAPLGETTTIRNDAFFDLAAGHLHFARFRVSGRLVEAALSTDARSFALNTGAQATPQPEAGQVGQAGIGAFFGSGVVHILGGLDHLAFLVAVLLTVSNSRGAVLAVSGFTIGHSLSLAAAVGGFIALEGAYVEALIAFSIWLVAVEVLLRQAQPDRERELRWAAIGVAILTCVTLSAFLAAPVLFGLGLLLMAAAYLKLAASPGAQSGLALALATALFGLVHGFGFAGALQEAFSDSVGLGLRLAAFNIGVEAGQLLFIGAIGVVGFFVARLGLAPERTALLRPTAALMLCVLGAYWFVDRTLVNATM